MLKKCSSTLGTPLAALFSNIFHVGEQPTQWKTANVTPVYKKRQRSHVENYRPISLLAATSKVMETVINSALMTFLDSRGIRSLNQYGFRRRLGTADALTCLHHEWISTISHGGCVRVLAVDIAGAFDKVFHQ